MSDVERSGVEKPLRKSLYKYLYKPLFVTLIVNKKENTVCIRCVFRDAYEMRIVAAPPILHAILEPPFASPLFL